MRFVTIGNEKNLAPLLLLFCVKDCIHACATATVNGSSLNLRATYKHEEIHK